MNLDRQLQRIEKLGYPRIETIRFLNLANGEEVEQTTRASEWPFVVYGLTAYAYLQVSSDPLGNETILIKFFDAQTEEPLMDDFLSLKSAIGLMAPRPMRLVKPWLLTENKGIRFKLKNTSGETMTECAITLHGWSVLKHGSTVTNQFRI